MHTSAPSPSQTANDIVHLDAVRLMELIHRRELSCVDVMTAYLDRIDRHNPEHNALVCLRDREQLLAEARAKDSAPPADTAQQLLHGMPQAPKDLQAVAGMKSTHGSRILKDMVPDTDAEHFARLRESGAIFIARSNTPEFGLGGHTYNAVYGATRNAWQPALSAGGSSGGAAVAVAQFLLPLADGSDMMGSLRTPAAFNGVYGLRTTPGLVPNGPQNPLVQPALSVAGPMARTIPDLALLLSVMAGFPASLPFTPQARASAFTTPLMRDFRGARVGWLGDLGGYLAFDDGVLQACEAALPVLRDLGCQLEACVPAFDYHALWNAWLDLRSALFFRNNAELLNEPANFEQIKPEAQWEFRRGAVLEPQQIDDALKVRRQWQDALSTAFAEYDFLLLPSCQVFPFPVEQHWPARVGGRDMDTYHRWMEVVVPATMGGTPALSVPAGNARAGRGAGLQIIAPPHADLAAMQLAHAFDEARPRVLASGE